MLAFAVARCTPPGPPDAGVRCNLYLQGSACSTPDAGCESAPSCTNCGNGYYVLFPARCTCNGSTWFCPHPDCIGPGPGVYESDCTTLARDHRMPYIDSGTRDTGAAVDAADADGPFDDGADDADGSPVDAIDASTDSTPD